MAAFSTIGDSFSIVATLSGIAVTVWAFKITCALLLPGRVEAARAAVSTRTGSCIGVGFLSLLIGFISFLILQIPFPGAKLFGMILLAGYLATVAIGASGISKLAAERLRDLKAGQANMFDSYAKASLYLVIASFMPVLGWFLFAPLVILIGGGAGLIAVLKPARANEVA